MTSLETCINRLSKEKSPYLLQHQHNPVNWYPWGEEAFAAARKEDKPIFLSIGYSTCYWCHVMEKDSFETREAADVLNKYFISIKIDREERPDIDQVYMDAVQAMTGHGGWPLSVFLDLDLKPFWGGTFFYRDQFIQILNQLHQVWEQERERVTAFTEKVAEALGHHESQPATDIASDEVFAGTFASLQRSFDPVSGSFGQAPKFPPCMKLELLLRIYRRSQNQDALKMVTVTLDSMARGGIFDHLEGGFARYSTDRYWLVPHFEKMLYDNALLAQVYIHAFQVTGDENYRRVIEDIFSFVESRMTSPEGAFYTALDAGEVGREGEYYVWSHKELETVLTEADLNLIKEYYSISEAGNFEGNNVLALKEEKNFLDKKVPEIERLQKLLLDERSKRPPPHLDDKILTGWNSLMISALAEGYRALRDKKYLERALKAARFLESNLFDGNKLLRRFRDGEAKFEGTLEDYAYHIAALLDLYQATFDVHWLRQADTLQRTMDHLFHDSAGGGYFFSTSSEVFFRKKDLFDGAIPSATAVALHNLERLLRFFPNSGRRERLEELYRIYRHSMEHIPHGVATALSALDFHLDAAREVVIVRGSNKEAVDDFLEKLGQKFEPNTTVAVISDSDEMEVPLFKGKHTISGKTAFFVCENNTCQSPVESHEDVLSLLKSYKQLTL